MDAGQRSTKVSSSAAPAPSPSPAVKRIQKRGAYFNGYTWAEVLRDPLLLALTALHLFLFWYLCHYMEPELISTKNLLGCMLLFGVVAQYTLVVFLFCDCRLGNSTAPVATAAASDGGGRGPAGPIGRTTTTTTVAPPPVFGDGAQPLVSVFCKTCGAYFSLKWCMGLDKYIIGCS